MRTNAVWEDRWSYSQSKQYLKCKAWWNAPFIQWIANQLVPQLLCPQQEGSDLSIFRPHSVPPPACSSDLCHCLPCVSVIYINKFSLLGDRELLIAQHCICCIITSFLVFSSMACIWKWKRQAPSRVSLWNPMDCSSVHGILQARILEWVAISFSRGSFQPGDRTCLTVWTTRDLLPCT